MPSTVKSVGKGAFYGCSSVVDVTIPSSLTIIPNDLFRGCTKISSVIIPSSVTSIGDNAFSYCSSLTTITIPDRVVVINSFAFGGCSNLATVVIPDSVIIIGQGAFSSTDKLSWVFYQGSYDINSDFIFSDCDDLKICVPPDFSGQSFCGWLVSPTGLCSTFRSLFNNCFKGNYVDGNFVQVERKNATEWERKTNDCIQYQCDNSTGPITTVLKPCEDPSACYLGYCNEQNGECERKPVDDYERLISQQNKCYEVVCDNDVWILKQRQEAKAWQDQSGNCYEYQCHNESGMIKWSKCNSSAAVSRMCINDACIESKPSESSSEERVSVVIEFNGVQVTDLNMAELISNISVLSGVDSSEFTVGVEVDDKGYIVRVVLYLNDAETATVIAKSVDGIEEEGCHYGILCNKRTVHVNGINVLSSGHHMVINSFFIAVLLILISLLSSEM